jgi:hypothetical protein
VCRAPIDQSEPTSAAKSLRSELFKDAILEHGEEHEDDQEEEDKEKKRHADFVRQQQQELFDRAYYDELAAAKAEAFDEATIDLRSMAKSTREIEEEEEGGSGSGSGRGLSRNHGSHKLEDAYSYSHGEAAAAVAAAVGGGVCGEAFRVRVERGESTFSEDSLGWRRAAPQCDDDSCSCSNDQGTGNGNGNRSTSGGTGLNGEEAEHDTANNRTVGEEQEFHHLQQQISQQQQQQQQQQPWLSGSGAGTGTGVLREKEKVKQAQFLKTTAAGTGVVSGPMVHLKKLSFEDEPVPGGAHV